MTLKECVDIEERRPCLTLTAHEAYFKERDDDADTTEYTEAWLVSEIRSGPLI